MLEREAFGNATVVAKLQAFHWVWVDRDHTPDLPKRMHVNAYPSLLVLGPSDENVHRWAGFLGVDKFMPQVDEALERYERFRAGKAWDEPAPRAEHICAEGEVETFAAPEEGGPDGIAFCGGKMFVAQGNTLYRLGSDRAVEHEARLPAMVRDLASDGERLFALTYGWTKGDPLYELDPSTGAVRRSLVTEANKKNKYSGAFGLACHGGKLFVLESSGKLHRLDPVTGEVEKTLALSVRYVSGLTFDGASFVLGSREALHFVDPGTGKVRRSVPVAYPVRALASEGGKLYLMEQPVPGFGRKHEPIRIWPKRMLVHELTLERR
ncbi:MAG: PQQ-binding-like beta-propeller repeat protein [Planctomycetota bacterium]